MKPEEKIRIFRVRSMLTSAGMDRSAQLLGIRNGIICSITEEDNPGPGIEIEDFGPLIITPLFCDYHLHFSGKSASWGKDAGQHLLRHGIGKAYDGGDKGLAGLSFKGTMEDMLEIITSGSALYKRGGYGAAIGQAVKGLDEAVRKIDELISCHVDYIKIINSGIYEPESGIISAGGFEATELRRIVDYAREKGLEVYCHANGEKAVAEAVDAGVSAIIHGLYARDETFAEMAERGVAFIPTVYAFQSLHAIAKTGTARLNIEKAVDTHLSALNRAFEHNVRVLPGSDSGPTFIPYGSAYIAELGLFLRAGIPFEEVLKSAATATIAAGAPANFVLLDGLSVKHVVLRGQFFL